MKHDLTKLCLPQGIQPYGSKYSMHVRRDDQISRQRAALSDIGRGGAESTVGLGMDRVHTLPVQFRLTDFKSLLA